jgi:5-methylcytosine-specific restriction endonuclease McrA
MAWKVDEDSAWVKNANCSFRHYSGVGLSQRGKLWHAVAPDGQTYPTRRTASGALQELRGGFWRFGQFGIFCNRTYGNVVHHTSPVSRDGDHQFVFFAPSNERFQSFLVSGVKRRFFGLAKCMRCEEPMSFFQTRSLSQFDAVASDDKSFLVCGCGHPVWHMPYSGYSDAFTSLEMSARSWRRKESLRLAGGKHSKEEIKEILRLQDNRCLYCDAQFCSTLRATKDHLVPLIEGGADWALNIVLACRGCNARRGDIPFRTYCRLLSRAQNKRILAHLERRILAIDYDRTPKDAFVSFISALSMHNPRHRRYKTIFLRKHARDNARSNKLLPCSPSIILRGMTRREKSAFGRR